MRSRSIAPEPYARSQRSPQLPAVTSVHDGATKQGSTPSPLAMSLPLSASYPVISGAVIWFEAHFVDAGRLAPFTVNDCGGYFGSVNRISVPRALICASLSFDGDAAGV